MNSLEGFYADEHTPNSARKAVLRRLAPWWELAIESFQSIELQVFFLVSACADSIHHQEIRLPSFLHVARTPSLDLVQIIDT